MTLTMLNDPKIRLTARCFLRSNRWATDPQKFAKFVNQEMTKELADKYYKDPAEGKMPAGLAKYMTELVLPERGIKLLKPLSVRTALRWMRLEGFEYKTHAKGVFVDAHKQPDVVNYCHFQ